MTWQTQRTGREYYYRSQRVNGRVEKTYIGRAEDPVVMVIAEGDELGRAERAAAVQDVRSEQAAYGAVQPLLIKLRQRANRSMRGQLHARGFRLKRGVWMARQATETTGQVTDDQIYQEDFQHLVQCAESGDEAAAAELRRLLRRNREIWEPLSALHRYAEESLFHLLAPHNLALQESLRTRIGDLRRACQAGFDDVTLKLLAENLAVCWLDVQYTCLAAVQRQEHVKDGRYWEDRYNRAHGRFLAAARELATVRRLLGDNEAVPLSLPAERGVMGAG